MSAPPISPSHLDHEHGYESDNITLVPRPHGGDRPSADNAAAVIEQLLDLAGQARNWQRALLRTSTEVEALTGVLAAVAGPGTAGPGTADPGAAGSRPGQAARAVGDRQVRAVISALAADAGTVTWLCIRAAGYEPSAVSPGTDDPVAGPLLARAESVRVLVCAPGTGPARALAGAHPGLPAGSLRVTRSGAALRGTRGDLVVATRADAIAVMADTGGAPCADVLVGTAVNALVRALVDSLWDSALPPATAERIEEVARDPVKLKILGLLEAGAKDEVIARTLGVSLRTCRRHIAELLSAADAGSRFQAASRLARAGLLSAAG